MVPMSVMAKPIYRYPIGILSASYSNYNSNSNYNLIYNLISNLNSIPSCNSDL